MNTSPPAQQIKTRTVFQVGPRLAEHPKPRHETQDCLLKESVLAARLPALCLLIFIHLWQLMWRDPVFLSFGAAGSIHSDKTAVNKPQTSAAQSCCTSCTQQCITVGDFPWMRRHGSINLHSLPSSPVASWQLSLSHHGVDYKGRHLH